MAMPKYKREKINAKTEVERFGGLADQAAAEGQGRIASAQKGLAAQHGQRAGQEVASFAARLNDFVNSADQVMRADATRRGQRKGIKDVSKRREEIFKITRKYAHDPKLMEQKIAELETATYQDDFSFYGRAYGDARDRAYVQQVELDAANAASLALADANQDPEAFKRLYQTYKGELLKGAPTEVGAIAAQKAFDKHGISTYSKMTMTKYSRDLAQQKENTDANIVGMDKLIKDASSRGDRAATASYLAQYDSLLKAQVNAGTMGGAEAAWLVQDARVTAQTNEFMLTAKEWVKSGNGWNFINTNLRDPKMAEGKLFASLPAAAQEKILAQTKAEIATYEAAENGNVERKNKEVEVNQKENFRAMGEAAVKGTRWTSKEIADSVLDGTLSSADAKLIQANQDAITDPQQLMHYGSTTQLIQMNEEQIKNLPDISYVDKAKMLDKRKSALNGEYKWTNTLNGKEALQRLADDYGVAINPVFQPPGKPDANHLEYNAKRSEMYDRIMALPAIEREEKALDIYNQVSKEYKDKKEVAKQNNQELKDKANWEEAQQKIKEENEKKWLGQYTEEDWIQSHKEPELYRMYWDKVKSKYGKGATAAPINPPPAKAPVKKKPMPVVANYMDTSGTVQQAKKLGYTPMITGKDVDLEHVRDDVKRQAYPIMKKYGLGVKDGYRATAGGGAKKSQHLHGNALDVTWTGRSIAEKQQIIRDFRNAGFKGFGIGHNTIHIDRRKNPASWSYIGGTATGGGYMPRWAAEALRN